jgi:hypothetical protein
MNIEDALAELNRPSVGDGMGATPCPDEGVVAAYADGVLSGPDRAAIEVHLVDCARCRSLVGLLARPDDAVPLEPVPDHVLARARRLPARRRSFRDLVPLATAAAAAILAMAVFLQVSGPSRQGDEQAYREVRSASATTAQVKVLSPADGAQVRAGELLIRWTEVPGATRYEVRIVSDSGLLVTEQRVARTEWRPGPDLGLEPGREYFVRVDAFPADAPPVSSAHVPFTVTGLP